MPRYDYYCEASGRTVEVIHSIGERLSTWGEVVKLAGIDPGDTPVSAEVHRVITTPPMANTPAGNSHLKNLGFTKLERRYDGTYENVTRSGSESRFLKPGDASTMPHFHKKHSD